MVAPGFKDEEPSVIAFTETAPLDTAKSVASKDAIPLLLVVASSPVIVNVVPEALVFIPSPAANVNPSPMLAAAVEESSAVRVISFADTAPLDTVKFVELKDAIPLLLVLASSPAMVIVLSDTVVSIPSPPVKVKVSLIRETLSLLPESAPTVRIVEIVVKLTAPEPSVISACPLVPSAVGSVYPAVPSKPTSICLLNTTFSAAFVVSSVK